MMLPGNDADADADLPRRAYCIRASLSDKLDDDAASPSLASTKALQGLSSLFSPFTSMSVLRCTPSLCRIVTFA